MKFIAIIIFFFSAINIALSQPDRWQQRIKYTIDVDMNVSSNQFTGMEKIDYWNNSPDTLHRLFFHLFWNAFQPNSMMDNWSREAGKTVLGYTQKGDPVSDWDDRVADRISKLKPNEIGSQQVEYIRIKGKDQQLILHETILEVILDEPINPKSKTTLEVSFKAQTPIQIRRSGRDNADGVRYSMTQWYPKLCEYDYRGWNADPYVAREFYGVWGDFDVNITIDRSYMLAGTGTLQNPNEVGFGYEQQGAPVKQPGGNKLTWKFSAQNVHDFMWAADTTFTMFKRQVKGGPIFYFVYKKGQHDDAWQKMADTIATTYSYVAETFGPYPYKNYSFIQGGDGAMEYAMAALVRWPSLAMIHEWMHSWYQGVIGTNEVLYPWMDEGFTSYAEARLTGFMRNSPTFWYNEGYKGYLDLVRSGKEEPMSTPSDYFKTNYAYNSSCYSKGTVFLAQLGYIVGEENLDKILLQYYNEWKFKHPNPDDFIRLAEKVSGISLQWYKNFFINTTFSIDYALANVNYVNSKSVITIKKIGRMPMPLDVLVTYKDGSKEMHYIPVNLMYGNKPAEDTTQRIIHKEWNWNLPEYELIIEKNVSTIKQIEIDPSSRLADVNRVNNRLTVPD